MYLARVWKKNQKKNQNCFIQLCKCVFLTIFNVITSSNLILLPSLQLVLNTLSQPRDLNCNDCDFPYLYFIWHL